MEKPVTTPDLYASQRAMYIGRIDMARRLIRHLENEIAEIDGRLADWSTGDEKMEAPDVPTA